MTPSRHVLAWYSYAWASEAAATTGLSLFMLVTLERIARAVGYWSPDLSVPCTEPFPGGSGQQGACKVLILGHWIDTTSFTLYTRSTSVLLQLVLALAIGPLADTAYYRKRVLVTGAVLGAAATMSVFFLPASPSQSTPALAACLWILAFSGYSISQICSNAFLPVLARQDPRVRAALEAAENEQRGQGAGACAPSSGGRDNETLTEIAEPESEYLDPEVFHDAAARRASLLEPVADERTPLVGAGSAGPRTGTPSAARRYQVLLSLTTARISSFGNAAAFSSCVVSMLGLSALLSALNGTVAALQLCVGLCGIWWLCFAIPAMIALPSGPRSGTTAAIENNSDPENQGHSNNPKDSGKSANTTTAFVGLQRIAAVVRPSSLRRLPNLSLFLFAWLFLSDAQHTLPSTLILFATTRLGMPSSEILILTVIPLLIGALANFFVSFIQRRTGLANMHVLLFTVAAVLGICVFVSLPAFSWSRSAGWGLTEASQVKWLIGWFGVSYSLFFTFARTIYAEMIPPGHESTFFSLFALTDKSCSFLGPLLVAFITQTTGVFQYAFVLLMIMSVLPVPFLLLVDVHMGELQGRQWETEVKPDSRRRLDA